ncbi:hypothetical protein ACFO5Q_06565 [Kordiimonas lipolytica]|uniref:SMODS and SLOG-associating 2TM effector domain-containing protein n=1 Tax=Kordiimonas lipolytica TaxID=1662421 RepID=A0ABV8U9H2_9PROT|nr:hypothetical protein [Kordiimonas lipolytica]
MSVLHKENDEIKVYGPSTKALKYMLLTCGAASIPLAILMVTNDEFGRLNLHSCLAILMVAVICLNLWTFYKKLPHIKLSSKGIEVSNVFGKKFHSWESAGPFRPHKLDSKHVHIGYLCAHSRETEEMLRRGDNYIPADHENAEIKIVLQGLSAGLSDEKAEELCQEVNDWREKYGPQNSPLKSAQQDTFSWVKADLKKKSIKAKIRTYSIVAIVMAIIFYNVVWVDDHSQLKDTIGRIQRLIKE